MRPSSFCGAVLGLLQSTIRPPFLANQDYMPPSSTFSMSVHGHQTRRAGTGGGGGGTGAQEVEEHTLPGVCLTCQQRSSASFSPFSGPSLCPQHAWPAGLCGTRPDAAEAGSSSNWMALTQQGPVYRRRCCSRCTPFKPCWIDSRRISVTPIRQPIRQPVRQPIRQRPQIGLNIGSCGAPNRSSF